MYALHILLHAICNAQQAIWHSSPAALYFESLLSYFRTRMFVHFLVYLHQNGNSEEDLFCTYQGAQQDVFMLILIPNQVEILEMELG